MTMEQAWKEEESIMRTSWSLLECPKKRYKKEDAVVKHRRRVLNGTERASQDNC